MPVNRQLSVFPMVVYSALVLSFSVPMQDMKSDPSLDRKVKEFLDSRSGQWYDMNVPPSDGRFLHDLIVERGYRKALEIGTSTGHSAIWIAWALNKTGGKLITVEIDRSRYEEALQNFSKAGLSDFIDARLADAHELVPKLEGPFDFVFCDADKEWTKNYFTAVSPRLVPGGCFAVHNALISRGGIPEFLNHAKSLPDFETTVEQSRSTGISLSFRKTGSKP